MMYAREIDIKRGINEQFKDVYPHITITLSKIRRFSSHVNSKLLNINIQLASKGK